jgi:hypothetical protein
MVLASTKMLLLLLLLPEKLLMSAKEKEDIDLYLDSIEDIKYKSDARALISWINADKFKDETLTKARNQFFLKKLDKLKKSFFNSYLKSLKQEGEKDETAYTRACDVYTEINRFVLRIMRLRMVIQPKIQIAVNVHTQTKITYVAAKAFWYNEEGAEIRKFTKSMGRLEDYKMGKKDPDLLEEAETKIQEVMYKAYEEEYPD